MRPATEAADGLTGYGGPHRMRPASKDEAGLTGQGLPNRRRLASLNEACLIGRGDNRAVTELGFAHVTTKTWAYSEVFGFFRKIIWRKNCPPPPKSLFKNTIGNPFFGTPFFGTKCSKKMF